MGRTQSRSVRFKLPLIAVVAVAFAAAGCGTGDGTTAPPAGGAPTGGGEAGIDVTLQEWAVVPASVSTASGETTFTVTNQGPEDVHEFVIVRTDLDAGALPTDETGAVVEGGEGIEVIDEIEEMAVGATEDLTVSLEPGAYVLLCNIYDEEEAEAHYQLGMRTAFAVE